MSEYLTVLSEELGETFDDGAFLMQIRYDFRWDKEAFARLTAAMEECCRQATVSDKVDRWIVEGFSHLSSFVENWTNLPIFPREYPDEYYEEAYERLSNLRKKCLWPQDNAFAN
ncbi:MAG: hypothetical protein ABIY70_24415 [Capsulimonas sp.]|uniref:hypothetical protein n=1 Tax=Capsulimonas sp. TaxID=2494211 RepID=UPI003262CD80